MTIYVGNLPYATREDELRDLFAEHGTVSDVEIITDKATGRSRGFGFVEMPNEVEARQAIEKLNAADYSGRTLCVSPTRPKPAVVS